jgi:phospholipid/cholesterol/gamma-HCH transport system substrate-binding protein
VITASQKDLVANLQSLYPVLTKLAEAGANLPKSLELLFTYPFPDAAAKAVKGDFTNLDITLDVNTQKALQGLLGLNLPSVLPALPTNNVSLPLHNSPQFPANGQTAKLPPLPLPTGTATSCITLLGMPVCTQTLNRSAFDPELAKVLMPGVAK